MSAKGYVYFVRRSSGLIKIGFSTTPTIRLRAIENGLGESIAILAVVEGSRKLERHLHDRFAAGRDVGEWFKSSPDLLRTIDALDAGTYVFDNGDAPPKPKLNTHQDRYAKLEDGLMAMNRKTRQQVRRDLAGPLNISEFTLRGIAEGRSAVYVDQADRISAAYAKYLRQHIELLARELETTERDQTRRERLLAVDLHLSRARSLLNGGAQ